MKRILIILSLLAICITSTGQIVKNDPESISQSVLITTCYQNDGGFQAAGGPVSITCFNYFGTTLYEIITPESSRL